MLRVMLTTIALSAALLAAPMQDSGKGGKDALEATPWAHYPGPADLPGAGHKVVLIAGDEEYRSEEALPMLGGVMAKRHGFDCYVLFSTDPTSGEIDPMNQEHIEEDGTTVGQITSELSNRAILRYWKHVMLGGVEAESAHRGSGSVRA